MFSTSEDSPSILTEERQVSPKSELTKSATIERYCEYIRQLVEKGGPREIDYSDLDHWLVDVHTAVQRGLLPSEELARIRAAFGDVLSSATIPGFALTKPHGYAGDFEIIDRIYQFAVASDPRLNRWDRFCHQHAALKAVRNRKTYFHRLLSRHAARKQPLRALNIASGPGRSMFEWLSKNEAADVTFECVEMDGTAIEYASKLNHEFLNRLTFVQKNALRYRPSGQFDLIWAAGIFDYFDDKVFRALIQRLLPAVAEEGELVIGNFSDRNPSRALMEITGDWNLHHRSVDTLISLANDCGVPRDSVRIGSEPERVNLFLHIVP